MKKCRDNKWQLDRRDVLGGERTLIRWWAGNPKDEEMGLMDGGEFYACA